MTDFGTTREPVFRAAADAWRRILAQIHTHFGRLVFVARLRDPVTSRYLYRPLADLFGPESTDLALASSHRALFSDWIASALARQKKDLDEYLSESGQSPSPAAFRDLVPPGAHEVECQLYVTDLETLLLLLRFERQSAVSTPESSRHPLPVQ